MCNVYFRPSSHHLNRLTNTTHDCIQSARSLPSTLPMSLALCLLTLARLDLKSNSTPTQASKDISRAARIALDRTSSRDAEPRISAPKHRTAPPIDAVQFIRNHTFAHGLTPGLHTERGEYRNLDLGFAWLFDCEFQWLHPPNPDVGLDLTQRLQLCSVNTH